MRAFVELNVKESNLVQSVQVEASDEETEDVSENVEKVEQVQQAEAVEKVEVEVEKDSGNNSPTSEGKDHLLFLSYGP